LRFVSANDKCVFDISRKLIKARTIKRLNTSLLNDCSFSLTNIFEAFIETPCSLVWVYRQAAKLLIRHSPEF